MPEGVGINGPVGGHRIQHGQKALQVARQERALQLQPLLVPVPRVSHRDATKTQLHIDERLTWPPSTVPPAHFSYGASCCCFCRAFHILRSLLYLFSSCSRRPSVRHCCAVWPLLDVCVMVSRLVSAATCKRNRPYPGRQRHQAQAFLADQRLLQRLEAVDEEDGEECLHLRRQRRIPGAVQCTPSLGTRRNPCKCPPPSLGPWRAAFVQGRVEHPRKEGAKLVARVADKLPRGHSLPALFVHHQHN